MNHSIKGLAFDLDGTLVDSVQGLADALNLTLDKGGYPPVTLSQVKTWVGNGADILIARAISAKGDADNAEKVAQLRHYFNDFYQETANCGSQLYSGVIETLAYLSQEGFPLAVVTNKPSPFVVPLLEHLEIRHYFSVIVGGDDVIKRKPHPAPLYYVLAQLGLHASELLFVGDSRNDIEAAKAARCPSVGLTYGYNYGESITLCQPDFVLDNFNDILSLIKNRKVI